MESYGRQPSSVEDDTLNENEGKQTNTEHGEESVQGRVGCRLIPMLMVN